MRPPLYLLSCRQSPTTLNSSVDRQVLGLQIPLAGRASAGVELICNNNRLKAKMRTRLALLAPLSLGLADCVITAPTADIGDPVCLGGDEGRPLFQLSHNLFRTTPAGPTYWPVKSESPSLRFLGEFGFFSRTSSRVSKRPLAVHLRRCIRPTRRFSAGGLL